jgi:hypothetical protein
MDLFKNFKITNFLKKNKKENIEEIVIISFSVIAVNLGISLLICLFYGGLISFFKEIPEILLYSLLEILAFFLLYFIWWIQKRCFNSYLYTIFLKKNFIFKAGFIFATVHYLFLINKNFYLLKNYYKTAVILLPIIFFSWLNDEKYTIKYFLAFVAVSYIFLVFANFLEIYYINSYFLKKSYYYRILGFYIYHLVSFFVLQLIYTFFKKFSYKKYL